MFVQGYSYDDVLLIPKHSSIASRDHVSLSITLPHNIYLPCPIISANMSSVTDAHFAVEMYKLGGLAILHRFDTVENIVSMFKKAKNFYNPYNDPYKGFGGAIGASVGIKKEGRILAEKLWEEGCQIICVDVAHGDHEAVVNFVKSLRADFQQMLIIAGNVVTQEGADRLWQAGADIIKIGVGPGSVCSTRTQTGNGYPQLSALKNVCTAGYSNHEGEGPLFIADGGIKSAGDCVKALCFADMVMIGNLFAGTDEAPGNLISVDGKSFKQYAGSSTHKSSYIEGVSGLVPYQGKLSVVLAKLIEGIKSGCSYQGVSKVSSLQHNPEFVLVTNSGLKESQPHSIRL